MEPDRPAQHRSPVIAGLRGEKEAPFKQLLIEGEQRQRQALNPRLASAHHIKINGNCTLRSVVIGRVESFI